MQLEIQTNLRNHSISSQPWLEDSKESKLTSMYDTKKKGLNSSTNHFTKALSSQHHHLENNLYPQTIILTKQCHFNYNIHQTLSSCKIILQKKYAQHLITQKIFLKLVTKNDLPHYESHTHNTSSHTKEYFLELVILRMTCPKTLSH